MSTLREPTCFLNELELEKVNEQSKYTVFGYIRCQQTDHLSLNIIPKLIIVIILAFYTDNTDEFDSKKCGKFIKIYDDNKTIRHQPKSSANTAYGKRIISSQSNSEYIWKIKLIEGKGEMNIGIDNAQAKRCDGNIYDYRIEGLYAYYCKLGHSFRWDSNKDGRGHPEFIKKGDTLIMTLDLESKAAKLTYKINDNGKEFLCFKNILRKHGLHYRLAITLFQSAEVLKLIS